MQTQQALVINDSVCSSLLGTATFPEIIGRLAEAGVERYHADYCRQESTFYLANGDSLVVSIPYDQNPLGSTFQATDVEAAVRESQSHQHTYRDFIRKTMAAGCVGYFVQITGRQVIYFGRRGEMHLERFPTVPTESSQ